MDTIESTVYICKVCNVIHFILLSIPLLILLTNWSDILIIMFNIFYLKFYLLWFLTMFFPDAMIFIQKM